MIKPLSLAAYLSETFLFVVQTAWRLALVGTIIVIVAGILAALLRVLAFVGVLAAILTSLRHSVLPHLLRVALRSAWAAWAFVVLSSTLVLVLIQVTSAPGDLLVGPMDRAAADRLAEYRWLGNVVSWTYEVLWFVLLTLGFLVAKQYTLTRYETDPLSLIWRIARLPVLIGFVTLPMIFGAFVRPILYPVAAVSWKLGEQKYSLCGVLVGNDPGSVILWEQSRDYGTITKVPENAVMGLMTGPLTRPLSIRADPTGSDAQVLKANCITLQQKLAA